MIILDLALQGIAQSTGSMRVRLQSGYNAIVSKAVWPAVVRRGLVELLYATGAVASDTGLLGEAAKATGGITLMASDGTTFRVMRDLKRGSAQLLEFDREARSFSQIASDVATVSQLLRGRVGLPDRPTFESVFVLAPKDLPSQEGVPELDTGPDPNQPDIQAVRGRLEEVEAALKSHQEIEELEFELDGLQKQKFAAEDQLQALAFDRSELEEVEGVAHRLKYLDVVPDDFLERFEAQQQLKDRRATDLKRWEGERKALERSERTTPLAPVWRDWRLWVGLLVGAAAVTAAFFLEGTLRYVALVDVPAFGLATFVLYQYLTQREERDQARRRIRLSDQRREKILARDQKAIEEVEAILKKADLSKPEDVRAALHHREQVRARLAQLRLEEQQAQEDPQRRTLEEQQKALGTRVAELEDKLTTLSAVPIDVGAMRKEAEALREQVAEYERIYGPMVAEENGAAVEASNPMGATWLKAAVELLMTDPATAAKTLGDRASLLIRALSEERLTGVVVDPAGPISIRSGQREAPHAWDEMPGTVQDLAYLALRGALFLALGQNTRAPWVAEDLAAILPGGQDIVQMLYSTLAHGGQLIHLVARAEMAPKATHVAVFGTSG